VQDILGLRRDSEVVLDLKVFEKLVEGTHPNVPEHDVGGLEDCCGGVWVVETQKYSLCAEGKGFAGSKSGAVAQNLVVGVVYKLTLRWE
jgi:hypothetical protein